MEFASAGSGSRGNASIVRAGGTTLMVDCGFSFTEIKRRLARLDLNAEDIDAVLVTHEHGDHVSGVARFAARTGVPVFASVGTARAAARRRRLEGVQTFDSHTKFAIQDIEITPIAVPHDASEPTQFVFNDGAKKLCVMTDIGHVTRFVSESLTGLDALLLESNHDAGMLASGPYPPVLKKRVGGDYGHLSNRQTAEFLASLDLSRLHSLALAHLSEKNNRPCLARRQVASMLDCEPDWVQVADQNAGLAWQSL